MDSGQPIFISRGWEVANDYGSSIVSLTKQIADDEDVFVSFKADMQSDISVPEDVRRMRRFVHRGRRSLAMRNWSSRFSRTWVLT